MRKFFTLGPEGTCHHNALQEYLSFQGVYDAQIILNESLLAAADMAASDGNAYVLQCSAHLDVHLLTERYRHTLPIIDTFILPTQSMAVVKRRSVKSPKRLCLPEPTLGYINQEDWDELVFEPTKLAVTKKLKDGTHDAGIVYSSLVQDSDGEFETIYEIGEVVTTWILYGPKTRYNGSIIAFPCEILHEISTELK